MAESEKQRMARKWAWGKKHVDRLVELDAPKVIIAHALVGVIMPSLIRGLGIVDETAAELQNLIAQNLAIKSGLCYMCRKKPVINDDNLCGGCTSEVDQFCAEFGSDE